MCGQVLSIRFVEMAYAEQAAYRRVLLISLYHAVLIWQLSTAVDMFAKNNKQLSHAVLI
jgi:hypothetical protein